MRITLTLTVAALVLTGNACSLAKKKIAPKLTYRAAYLGSTDGTTFHSVLELLEAAEAAKPACRAINRKLESKVGYTVERKDTGIQLTVKSCEGSSADCESLGKCLAQRPVPWLTRASGLRSDDAGTIYTDWLGRCGGRIAVQFYIGPKMPHPVERVGCTEPQHDKIDTAYEMFLVARQETEKIPPAGPYIEELLRKWDTVVFHELDAVGPPGGP